MDVTVKHDTDMAFSGQGPSGHVMPMDAAPEVGGADSAPRPTEMLLAALGGCSGIDVKGILGKMRIEMGAFEIRLHGAQAAEHPRVFEKIHLEYVFRGADLEVKRQQIERAVQLSQEKYCSVAAMLGARAKLTYQITIEEASAG